MIMAVDPKKSKGMETRESNFLDMAMRDDLTFDFDAEKSAPNVLAKLKTLIDGFTFIYLKESDRIKSLK